ncbi:hypothetical protein P7K49_037357 [Saguinus oedipus]|uniref:Protein S100 n=1 Tax=Saguinus oedipus TaxID=9490 RepID=A0ABQ9THW1_SAGOE|nr:hypothetical protein P7K49_037357 [Saguinus oedipus]
MLLQVHRGPRLQLWSQLSLFEVGEAEVLGGGRGMMGPVQERQGGLRAGELHTVMETPLEKALTTLVTTFHKYSGREGSKLTLSRKELKELIEQELCLGEKMKESSIDGLMKSLDKNSDQEIDFKEYSVFLTTLCMAYNDFFLEDNK